MRYNKHAMPIYEYQCPDCGHRFELLRSFKDGRAPASCPRCGADESRRLLSVFAAPASADGDACGWNEAAGACFKGG